MFSGASITSELKVLSIIITSGQSFQRQNSLRLFSALCFTHKSFPQRLIQRLSQVPRVRFPDMLRHSKPHLLHELEHPGVDRHAQVHEHRDAELLSAQSRISIPFPSRSITRSRFRVYIGASNYRWIYISVIVVLLRFTNIRSILSCLFPFVQPACTFWNGLRK